MRVIKSKRDITKTTWPKNSIRAQRSSRSSLRSSSRSRSCSWCQQRRPRSLSLLLLLLLLLLLPASSAASSVVQRQWQLLCVLLLPTTTTTFSAAVASTSSTPSTPDFEGNLLLIINYYTFIIYVNYYCSLI